MSSKASSKASSRVSTASTKPGDDGKKIAAKAKKSDIFADSEYPGTPKKGGSSSGNGTEANAEYKKVAAKGHGSTIFDGGATVDTRTEAIDGASPKTFVKKKDRSEAEEALYSANTNAVKEASEARVKARAGANACSADSVLYDKEHEKQTYLTESMKTLEVEGGASSKTGAEAKAGRKAVADKSKGSTVFKIGDEKVNNRGLKTGIVNEVNRAPRGEINEENAAVSAEVKKDREAQRAKGFSSKVFGNDDGAYADDSQGSNQKSTDRPMGAGSYQPAEQSANQAANHAKRQALLAGSGALW